MHVAHFLFRSAARSPENPLWLLPDRTITYEHGAARVAQLAHGLLRLGQQRDRVAYLSVNRFEGLETYLATMAAGMTVVPLNPRGTVDEYAFLLDDSGSSVLIYSDDYREAVASLRNKCPSLRHVIAIGEPSPGDLSYEDTLAAQPRTPLDINIEPDDVAWLFYTSGTTGKPKGAMEMHRNLVTMVHQFLIAVIPDVAPSDVMFHAAPISHGTASCMLPHLAVGAAHAFPLTKNFEPARIFEAIERFRVTSSFLAPTMINLLLKSPDRARFDLSSLKNIIYGGGPMYVEQLKEAIAAFGPVFIQIYGQGEAPVTCTALPKQEHVVGDDPKKVARLGSAGREMPGVMVRILDADDQPVASGVHGEICVRSDLVMKGYWKRAEATAETLRNGWLHTGDVGYVDEDGYLFITDRLKDLIISGGSNVYPREVEEVILTLASVAEVSVFGVPDETWGEAVKAVVVRRAGMNASEADIIEHCRTRLASYKKPKSVEFAETLPKNPAGKILKRQLREKYWAGITRRV